MQPVKKRRALESGHHRKFLVLIDETPEFRTALFFAARVASRTGGRLAMLHVTGKPVTSSWMPTAVSGLDTGNQLTQDVVKQHRAWLEEKGIANLKTEAISRTGDVAEEIVKVINRDEDMAVLVLGAADSVEGPGPVVHALTEGSHAGEFPIPIYLVPGKLSFEEIEALA